MDGKREKTRGLSLFSLSLHLSPFHTKRNSQHVGRHDLQADGHVRDALVGPRSARRLGLDLRLDRPEISEPVARPVQELGPLGSVAAGLGPAIRGAAGPDELEDEGAASADVGAAGQEVAADLRGERGGLSFCCGGGGGRGPRPAHAAAPLLSSPPPLSLTSDSSTLDLPALWAPTTATWGRSTRRSRSTWWRWGGERGGVSGERGERGGHAKAGAGPPPRSCVRAPAQGIAKCQLCPHCIASLTLSCPREVGGPDKGGLPGLWAAIRVEGPAACGARGGGRTGRSPLPARSFPLSLSPC